MVCPAAATLSGLQNGRHLTLPRGVAVVKKEVSSKKVALTVAPQVGSALLMTMDYHCSTCHELQACAPFFSFFIYTRCYSSPLRLCSVVPCASPRADAMHASPLLRRLSIYLHPGGFLPCYPIVLWGDGIRPFTGLARGTGFRGPKASRRLRIMEILRSGLLDRSCSVFPASLHCIWQNTASAYR